MTKILMPNIKIPMPNEILNSNVKTQVVILDFEIGDLGLELYLAFELWTLTFNVLMC